MVLLLLPSLALDAGAKARPGNDLTSNIFFPLLLAVSLSCANMYKERERESARTPFASEILLFSSSTKCCQMSLESQLIQKFSILRITYYYQKPSSSSL